MKIAAEREKSSFDILPALGGAILARAVGRFVGPRVKPPSAAKAREAVRTSGVFVRPEPDPQLSAIARDAAKTLHARSNAPGPLTTGDIASIDRLRRSLLEDNATRLVEAIRTDPSLTSASIGDITNMINEGSRLTVDTPALTDMFRSQGRWFAGARAKNVAKKVHTGKLDPVQLEEQLINRQVATQNDATKSLFGNVAGLGGLLIGGLA